MSDREKTFPDLDEIDLAILHHLQRDASISNADLGERVGLSTTPCWRRVQKLEESGVIQRRVALVEPEALNLGLTAYVAVRTKQHSQAWFDRFAEAIEAIPEVIETHRMSGDIDYLLRVVVPDIRAYDRVYKRLIEKVDFLDVSSSFAMERIKQTTALPIDYALERGSG